MEKKNENTTRLIKRIAIVGPESTGKTTLAKQLAMHYQTTWVSEYARRYIETLKRKYTLNDIEIISKKQMQLEDEQAKKANNYLFCDTNLVVSKIWAEFVFADCPQWITNEIKKRKYDLYLLTNIDLPWVRDEQREHPNHRKELYERYVTELKLMTANYFEISGTGETRVLNAKKIIDQL